jgi:hypothetical protein
MSLTVKRPSIKGSTSPHILHTHCTVLTLATSEDGVPLSHGLSVLHREKSACFLESQCWCGGLARQGRVGQD